MSSSSFSFSSDEDSDGEGVEQLPASSLVAASDSSRSRGRERSENGGGGDSSDEKRRQRRRRRRRRDKNSDNDGSGGRRRRRRHGERKERKKQKKKQKKKKKSRKKRSRSRSRSRSPTDGRDGDRRRRRRGGDDLPAALPPSVAAPLADEKGGITASRALVVATDPPEGGGGGNGTKEQQQQRRRRPRPTAGRSFASVSRGVEASAAAAVAAVSTRKSSSVLLMIEDGRAEDDGTRGRSSSTTGGGGSDAAPTKEDEDDGEVIDFVRAYLELVRECPPTAAAAAATVADGGLGLSDEARMASSSATTETGAMRTYLERQRDLNERTRADPHDVWSWMELAHLSQQQPPAHAKPSAPPPSAATQAEADRTRRAELERRREILKAAVGCNPDNIEVRVALLRCTERLCLLSALDPSELASEHDDAVRDFEVLAAEENDWRVERDEVVRAAGKGGGGGDRPAATEEEAVRPQQQLAIPPGRRGRGVSNLPAWMTSTIVAGSSSEPDRLKRDYDDKDEVSPKSEEPPASRTADLLRLHRMGLRRVPSSDPTKFDADFVRRSFRDAFRSLDKVRGEGTLGPEAAVLFLDYLRVEAAMGYSERSVGMVQAALEMNLRSMTKEAEAFWDSAFPRFGDVYPGAGWAEWKKDIDKKKSAVAPNGSNSNGVRESRKKRQRRLKASDFFGDSVGSVVDKPIAAKNETADAPPKQPVMGDEKKILLLEAYEAASHSHCDDMDSTAPKREVDQDADALKLARSIHEEKQHAVKDHLVSVDDGEASEGSKGNLDVNDLARDGDVVPSDVLGGSGVVQVYSFVHKRRIEISKDELSATSTKRTLRRVLQHLRQQKENGKVPKRKKARCDHGMGTKIHSVQENDPFLVWGRNELTTQNIYNVPLTALEDSAAEAIDDDPNRTVLLEDGVSELAIPYLSNFNPVRGVPPLAAACLRFFGVLFPRTASHDELETNSFSLGSGERLSEVGEDWDGFRRVFSGAFEPASKTIDAGIQWIDIYRQILVDESIVVFDSKLFKPGNEKQKKFVRNLLHDMVSTLEDSTDNAWTSYVQASLIMFEAEAAGGNIDQARTVARGILAGTEAAKCDPRLWMAYARLESRLASKKSSDKPTKSALKVLISALEATGETGLGGAHSLWWAELSLMVVRLMLHIPIDSRLNRQSLQAFNITEIVRDRVLHVLCCAVEGKFTPLPKEQRSKKQVHNDKSEHARLVTTSRLLKCQQILRGKRLCMIARDDHDSGLEVKQSKGSGHQPFTDYFDCTSMTFNDATLAAWLHALAPTNCVQEVINFNAGIFEMKAWIEEAALLVQKKEVQNHKATKACIVRLCNLMLEFYLLKSGMGSGCVLSPSAIMRSVLVPSATMLKRCKSTPSKSLLLAIAFAESQLSAQMPNMRGYLSLCSYLNCEVNATDIAFILAKAILIADKETRSFAQGAVALKEAGGQARCQRWTREGHMRVKQTLLESIDAAGYCSYPSLWHALLRLDLLGQITAKTVATTSRLGRVFEAAKADYERGLTRCMHSKRFWLDAFTILRPAFSEGEMLAHLATIEAIDLRLVTGLEDIDVDCASTH